MEECCGTCKYHRYDISSGDWVCCNGDSENVADWTEYNDVCEEWEGREYA